jgi:hypothetical protein
VSNGIGVLNKEPEILFFNKTFYVFPVPKPDEDGEWFDWSLTLSWWFEQVLKVGLLRDDDLAWIKQAALYAVNYFGRRLYTGFDAIAWRACSESVYHALDQALSESDLRGLDQYWDYEPFWLLRDLRLKESRDEGTGHDLGRLREYQKDLAPIWVSAKKDAHEAQDRPLLTGNWRRRVKNSYDVQLPDDLIEWLNKSSVDRQSNLLAYNQLPLLQERLREGYELSKPSDIALEHAARLCAVSPYEYAISSLWKIYRRQGDMENLDY